jgi:hypothetical protein
MGDTAFYCDICGRRRVEAPNVCPHCGNSVCNRCWNSQAGKGHELAEHRHEMAMDAGSYTRGDEDVIDW